MSEYPEVYIDDLGLHLMLKMTHFEMFMKVALYKEEWRCPKQRDFNEYIGILGRRDISTISRFIKSELPHLECDDFRNPNCPFDFYHYLHCIAAKMYDKEFGTTFSESYINNPNVKHPLIFEGVYIPSDIMMKQNQKRFDEYKQQIQHQQEEINKLNEQMKQQNEQIKQLTDTNAKLSNENEILMQKQTIIDREAQHNENVLSNIHEQAINVLKSYGGNWVMNAFSPQRQEEVLNYLYHRYKTISTSDLKKAFDSILDELSNINLKPFGE